jgi:hypothetical protein
MQQSRTDGHGQARALKARLQEIWLSAMTDVWNLPGDAEERRIDDDAYGKRD